MNKLWLALLVVWFCGCSTVNQQSQPSLYERLGKTAGIDALVYELLVEIADDDRIVDRFTGVNIERFKTGLVNYLCSISGGPCVYTGDSMRVVHAGHGYTETEFNALVENLITAMNRREIDIGTQNQLLAGLAPSYQDVVYR